MKKHFALGGTPISRVISLVIKNDDYEKAKAEGRTPVIKKVKLFGSNLHQLEANPDNVQVLESDYVHLMKWLLSNKIAIGGFRVIYSDCSDVSKDEEVNKTLVWGVSKKDVFGQSAYYPLDVLAYFKEDQNIRNIIEVFPYEINIDGNTYIEVPVLNQVQIIFFVSSIQTVSNKELLEKIEVLQKRLSYYINKVRVSRRPIKKSKPSKKKKSGRKSLKRK